MDFCFFLPFQERMTAVQLIVLKKQVSVGSVVIPAEIYAHLSDFKIFQT